MEKECIKMVNSVNSSDNLDKRKSTYNAKNQSDYRKKVKQYNVKYSLSDEDKIIVDNIESARGGMSANAWIQLAIREKLERDGFI
jgi:hypothetical protein